jgi:hypothetical protein
MHSTLSYVYLNGILLLRLDGFEAALNQNMLSQSEEIEIRASLACYDVKKQRFSWERRAKLSVRHAIGFVSTRERYRHVSECLSHSLNARFVSSIVCT